MVTFVVVSTIINLRSFIKRHPETLVGAAAPACGSNAAARPAPRLAIRIPVALVTRTAPLTVETTTPVAPTNCTSATVFGSADEMCSVRASTGYAADAVNCPTPFSSTARPSYTRTRDSDPSCSRTPLFNCSVEADLSVDKVLPSKIEAFHEIVELSTINLPFDTANPIAGPA